jgi:hypothetical protein
LDEKLKAIGWLFRAGIASELVFSVGSSFDRSLGEESCGILQQHLLAKFSERALERLSLGKFALPGEGFRQKSLFEESFKARSVAVLLHQLNDGN